MGRVTVVVFSIEAFRFSANRFRFAISVKSVTTRYTHRIIYLFSKGDISERSRFV